MCVYCTNNTNNKLLNNNNNIILIITWCQKDHLRSCVFLSWFLGVYFARHASIADRYSTSIKNTLPLYGGDAQSVQYGPTKVIFLARVIIGKSIVGETDFQKPDHKSSENYHDSCVDNIKYPNYFIIFDSNQIYPEYLIQYSWYQDRIWSPTHCCVTTSICPGENIWHLSQTNFSSA